jgi:hypothetical protein
MDFATAPASTIEVGFLVVEEVRNLGQVRLDAKDLRKKDMLPAEVVFYRAEAMDKVDMIMMDSELDTERGNRT